VLVERIDNVAVAVENLDEAVEYFTSLGFTLTSVEPIEGEWIELSLGIPGVSAESAMLEAPLGETRLQLIEFAHPAPKAPASVAGPGTVGNIRIAIVVENIEETAAVAVAGGGKQLGEIQQMADAYKVCFIQAPQHVTLLLLEELSIGGSAYPKV